MCKIVLIRRQGNECVGGNLVGGLIYMSLCRPHNQFHENTQQSFIEHKNPWVPGVVTQIIQIFVRNM